MFDINSGYQILGWVMVFIGLIIINEIGRRTKLGGIIIYMAIPVCLTIFFIILYICAGQGANWALNNDTYVHMNGWFHYAKLYAATIGCIGFIILKYRWGSLGKAHWFLCWPFVIVGLNILIAVASDLECASHWHQWWLSSEGVWLYGGEWNVFNAIAGVLNILCMTGWWGIYSSKKNQDMLWPDMTWVFIIAYDIWNFTYTYNCLPTHAWYCGFALLLAPTVAAFLWNKGGWIQNRAFTLSAWCMFAQMFPLFQDDSIFTTVSGLSASYATGTALTGWNMAWSTLALVANIIALIYIICRAKKLGRNPYTQEVFIGTKDYNKAISRGDDLSMEKFREDNDMTVEALLSGEPVPPKVKIKKADKVENISEEEVKETAEKTAQKTAEKSAEKTEEEPEEVATKEE